MFENGLIRPLIKLWIKGFENVAFVHEVNYCYNKSLLNSKQF